MGNVVFNTGILLPCNLLIFIHLLLFHCQFHNTEIGFPTSKAFVLYCHYSSVYSLGISSLFPFMF